ncbi:ubiquitin-like domain-containing protein CIP73 [Tasmannia lanceolata]|uniref:ubiquitin-like domain-containing protein CIP73 n=1 Tax=Tasmannia lanceolata TaxID=3420 RepID=UPI004063A235
MKTNGTDGVIISGGDEAECSETTVEIKIKTLDSHTYTLRVNKRMPVPALKEQIASVTGVLSEQQRLICRGKVLKDDQLLSEYHVEDGHTLHLVVRQPFHSSSSPTTGFMGSESAPDNPATDPTSNAADNQGNQVAHSVVLGTFNISDQGDGPMPDLNRIVSSVLSSIGIGNIGTGTRGIDLRDYGPERLGRTAGVGGMSESVQVQTDQTAPRAQHDPLDGAFRIPPTVSMGPLQPTVIPDSLTTLSEYLSHMIHEFGVEGIGEHENNNVDGSSHSSGGQWLPTAASLAEVILSTRQMLTGQAGECLLQLATQLMEEAIVTDPIVRINMQSRAMRYGVLMQNLGALLLELGRTTMTLRMGHSPLEAVVNAGPAVFISRSGPNPIMVQSLPFQLGTSFDTTHMGSVHPGHALARGGTLGSGLLPRNIDIRIHTGSSMSTANANLGEPAPAHQPPGQTNPTRTFLGVSGSPSLTVEHGVRVVPVRTVNRPPSDSPGSSVGLFYPLLARFQNPSPGHLNDTRGSQPSSEHHYSETTPPANTSAQQQQGSLPTSNSSQQELHGNSNNSTSARPSDRHGFQVEHPPSLLEAGIALRNADRLSQLLRTIFRGEHFHVNHTNIQDRATGSGAGPTQTTTAEPHEASRAEGIEQGIFLSHLLQQIMPFISQHMGMDPPDSSTFQNEDGNSFGAESSHRRDGPSSPPNSKRQKGE